MINLLVISCIWTLFVTCDIWLYVKAVSKRVELWSPYHAMWLGSGFYVYWKYGRTRS